MTSAQVQFSQIMPFQCRSGMMTSGLVLGCSHRLFLPPPTYYYAAGNPASLRLWKEPSRRSISSDSLSANRKVGRLDVSACYSDGPPSSGILANGLAKENSFALPPSRLLAPTNSDRVLTNEAAESPKCEAVVDRFNLPEVTESYCTLEAPEDHMSSLDPELQGIIANIADVEKLNEILGERMRNIQELLGKTTKSLNAKAQEAKIEAAKLKKLAKLHQLEEIRRVEIMKKNLFEARMKMARSNVPTTDRLLDLSDLHNLHPMSNDGQVPQVTLTEISGSEVEPQSNLIPSPDVVEDGPESVGSQSQLSKVEAVQTQSKEENEQNLEDFSLFAGEGEDELEHAAGISESEECIVAHPGALSCTKTFIRSDPSKKSAVITMETTVKCDGDAGMVAGLEENDYIALGVQTLVEAAQDLKKMRFARARDPDLVLHEKHTNILNLLANGRVVKAKAMEPPSKFGHESFLVDLQNEQTGEKLGLHPNSTYNRGMRSKHNHLIIHFLNDLCEACCWFWTAVMNQTSKIPERVVMQIEAMFKPGIEGNADGWHRAPIEMVAYKLNLMLGMDYVPPAVYKSGGVDVNYRRYNDGAFVYFVPNSKHLRKVPAANWGVSVALLLSDTRILDVLLHNSDRHHGHFLFGEHWADGKMRPVLIDHAAGFRKEAVVKMDHENAFKTGAVKSVSARTYLRLRFLEKDHVASTFEGLLSAREVNELMQRRDTILSYLDNLVEERGYYRTVIET